MAFKSSFSQNLDIRNRGETEQKKKLKKIRSIKLPKLSGLKQSTRRVPSQFNWPSIDLSSDDSSPKQLGEKKESSQGGSEAEVTSVSSQTYERKKTLKKSRSKKLASFGSFRQSRRQTKSRFNRPSVVFPDDELTPQKQPSVEVSDGRKVNSQANPRNSESVFDSSEHSNTSSLYSQSNTSSSSQKSTRTLTTTSSLRTGRILKSKTSFKSKRPSMKQCSEMPQDLSVERATCSSALKDFRFPKPVELHPGEIEPERISEMKVCPYHHCSLHGHGHGHASVSPTKHYVDKKRRSLKTGKGMEPENLSRPQEGANASTATAPIGLDFSIEFYAKPRAESFRGASQEIEVADLDEILFVEISRPEKSFQENLNHLTNFPAEKHDILERVANIKETSSECCSTELSQEPDDKVSNCNEEAPNLDLELSVGSNVTKGSTPNDFGESTEDNGVISSASNYHPVEEVNTTSDEKNGDSKPDSEFVNGSVNPVGDHEGNATGSESKKPRFNKDNHVSMWHLIHQHMVSGLGTEAKTQPLQGADEEKRVDDANTLPETQQMGTENNDTVSQETELHKIFAIKLVREAIEKILLPEVQDQSSDDQSITGDVVSEQELSENGRGEGGELSISTSTEVSHQANNFSGPEEEKTAKEVGNKKSPKRWSYLKKLILLKRFIKELEKVRKFNPRTPRDLPLETDSEAGKVSLRPQTTGEKKNVEEWMLDYALRQVVSQLAPTQKRKVALLVKAFETVVPPQEDQHIQVRVSKLKESSQELCSSKSQLDESISEANDAEWKAEEIVASNLDHGDKNSNFVHKHSVVSDSTMPIVKDPQLCNNFSLKSDDIMSHSSEKVPVEEKAQKVLEDMVLSSNSELCNGSSESSGNIVELDNLSDIESNANIGNSSDELTAAKEEKNREVRPEHVVPRGFPPLIGSETDDKQNHIRMWHMIYHHVVTGIVEKVGTQLLLDGTDEDEQVDDANKNLQEVKSSGSAHNYSTPEYDLGKENHDTNPQKLELSRSDAVKLVQEAVDEILLPEIQDDSSDTQSIASDIVPDQELLGKSCGDGDAVSLDQEEKGSAIYNTRTPEEVRSASVVGNKSGLQKPKNWSKLKKLILLKRSIKALEKVRKLKPKPAPHLPLTRDPEAEKVDLRHQMMDERKKAEQWMLDYAVQHIVTQLTPARKRRVAMLVEAFEAVVPLPEI